MALRRAPILVLLAVTACGSNPTSPNQPVFSLSAGAYRLQFGGANCIIVSAGGAGVGTSFDAQITLSAQGANWTIAPATGTLTGSITSDGRTLTATLGGYFDFAGTRFLPGPTASDVLSLSGFAAASDRFEGAVLAGRPTFLTISAEGGAFATCQSGNFTLRRAS